MAKLELKNVSYSYSPGTPFEKKALQNISLCVEAGSITGIIGHTGSGKSTLVRMFNGLLSPNSGEVLLDGVDINADKKALASVMCRVGLVMQYPEYQLFEETVFKDIADHWAEEYILQASERKLVQGYNGLYRPDDSMTRAELVTVLWRAMGQPEPKQASTFTDLKQDWYKDAVAWAQENAVINGVGAGLFGPDGNVTREQLATILHRLSGGKVGMEAMFTSIYDQKLTDADKISSYAKSAVYWCIYNGVYCGETSVNVNDTLIVAPKADATRGQIAVMMNRYLDRDN